MKSKIEGKQIRRNPAVNSPSGTRSLHERLGVHCHFKTMWEEIQSCAYPEKMDKDHETQRENTNNY